MLFHILLEGRHWYSWGRQLYSLLYSCGGSAIVFYSLFFWSVGIYISGVGIDIPGVGNCILFPFCLEGRHWYFWGRHWYAWGRQLYLIPSSFWRVGIGISRVGDGIPGAGNGISFLEGRHWYSWGRHWFELVFIFVVILFPSFGPQGPPYGMIA